MPTGRALSGDGLTGDGLTGHGLSSRLLGGLARLGLGPARLLAWRPPAIAFGAAALAGAAQLALWGTRSPWGNAPLAGGALTAIGAAWLVWAWAVHRAAGNPIAPTAAPRVLVDHGPYRIGRHPMYLGIAAMLVGGAVALGVPLLVLSAAGFVFVVATVHVPHEEARLASTFGGWWRDYAARVRPWL